MIGFIQGAGYSSPLPTACMPEAGLMNNAATHLYTVHHLTVLQSNMPFSVFSPHGKSPAASQRPDL